MKIDLHTHILPKDWPDMAERYGYDGFVRLDHYKDGCARMLKDGKPFREITANCWDPKKRVEEMEEAGVDIQVLSTVPVMFNYWARPKDTLDIAKFLNDHISSIVGLYPKRFVGLGTLPMQDPARAVDELDRCVRLLGLAGVQIGSHVGDWNLDAPELFPVFKAIAKSGAAVFVHPWDMMGQDRMKKYWLPWLVGMPAETARAVCSILFGGVLERLPDLRICFAHGGGSFPGTIGRIEHGFKVRPDLCAVDNKKNPRDYLGKFYVDSLVHDAGALVNLIGLIGAEKIALGSDYPFPLGEAKAGQLIESMKGLSVEAQERLLSGTAIEFLGLKQAAYV